MKQKLFSKITVNVTVNTLEFFQWCTGLNTREEIEEELYSQYVVGEPGYDGCEEIAKILDNEQITINSYFRTEQDIELTINNDFSVIIVDGCPFIPELNN